MYDPSIEEIFDELAQAHALRGKLIDRIDVANKRIKGYIRRLADTECRIAELRAMAAAGPNGLDRRAA